MDIKTVTLTDKDKLYCEIWLSNLAKFTENLNRADEYTLRKLIRYEIITRQRAHVLRRLRRRHNKLRNRREREEIIAYIQDHNRNRASYRELPV